MSRKRILAVAACVTIAGACSMFQRTDRVDEKLVAQVPPGQMSDVQRMRTERDELDDERARAELSVAKTKEERDTAQKSRDIASERRDDAQSVLDDARKGGSEKTIEGAEADLEKANDAFHESDLKFAVAQCKVDRDEAVVTLAKQRVRLAEARIELAKASAVHELDNKDAEKISMTSFEDQVRKRETDVKIAEVKLRAAEEALDRAESRD
jgi:hypothetical protein